MILYLCHMTPDLTWPWALWVDHLRCQGNLPNHPTKSIPWICKGLYIGIWNEEERLLNLIVFTMTRASITYKFSNKKKPIYIDLNFQNTSYIMLFELTNLTKEIPFPALTWWCHDMKTFSVLLGLCEGNPPITDGFPHKGPVPQTLVFSRC